MQSFRMKVVFQSALSSAALPPSARWLIKGTRWSGTPRPRGHVVASRHVTRDIAGAGAQDVAQLPKQVLLSWRGRCCEAVGTGQRGVVAGGVQGKRQGEEDLCHAALRYCNNLKRFKQHCEDTPKVTRDAQPRALQPLTRRRCVLA